MKAYYNATSLTGCTSLLGVTRREDQAEFTNYPATTTVWERVKKADGSYAYYKWVNGVKASGTFTAEDAGNVFGD